MGSNMTLTQERLKELLHYDPVTGIFTRLIDIGKQKAGSVAGYPNPDGYLIVKIDGRHYFCSRLAWLYVYGNMDNEVDHRDTNRANNSIINLRLATRSQNICNSNLKKSNKVGLKGVYLHKKTKKYVAQVSFNKVQYYLGLYDTPEMAHQAYRIKAAELHGEFARTE
jgi:hypothetical protein